MYSKWFTSLTVLVAVAAASLLGDSTAVHAQEMCFPTPYTGGLVSGPPRWSSGMPGSGIVVTDINEPRWSAFDPQRFFNDLGAGSVVKGLYRLIRNGDHLYVSMQAQADDSQSPMDFISFGIHNATKDTGGVFSTPLNTTGADPAPATGSEYANWVPGSTLFPSGTLNGLPPNGWILPGSVGSFRRHEVTAGGADWAIQFVVDLAKLQIENGDQLSIYMAMRPRLNDSGNRQPVLSVPARPSNEDWAEVGQTLVPREISRWRETRIDAPCADGLTFNSTLNIGTVQVSQAELSHLINTSNNQVNTFSARPDWGSVNRASLRAGDVTARFRIADWGAQSPGADAFREVPGLGSVNHNGVTGYFEQVCARNADGLVCGGTGVGLDSTNEFQCMIVELSSTAGVPIKTPIQYRNMRFQALSRRELDATITAKGLRAITGRSGQQTILLNVVTRNMPVIGDWPMFLDGWLLNYVKQFAVGALNAINPFGVSVTAEQQMKMAWPTYEAHTYFWTGRTRTYRGETYQEYSPMNSFGYYFSHDGLFYGYTHTVGGQDTFRLGSGETYEIRVPEEGRRVITTGVQTESAPRWLTLWGRTLRSYTCETFRFCI